MALTKNNKTDSQKTTAKQKDDEKKLCVWHQKRHYQHSFKYRVQHIFSFEGKTGHIQNN